LNLEALCRKEVVRKERCLLGAKPWIFAGLA
jgi:hypothetical protein